MAVQQAGVRQPIDDCTVSNEPPESPAGPALAFTESAQGRVGKWLGMQLALATTRCLGSLGYGVLATVAICVPLQFIMQR